MKIQKYSFCGKFSEDRKTLVDYFFVESPGLITMLLFRDKEGKWQQGVRLMVKDKTESVDENGNKVYSANLDKDFELLMTRDKWLPSYLKHKVFSIGKEDDFGNFQELINIPTEEMEQVIALIKKNDKRIKI